MKKKELKPASEARFRVLLILLAVIIALSAFSIADGYPELVSLVPAFLLIVGFSAPDRFLDALDRKLSLLRLGLPLAIGTVILFFAYIGLLRLDQPIPATAVFLLFSGAGFLWSLQTTLKSRTAE